MFFQGPMNRKWKAFQLLFKHVVIGAFFHALDRELVSQRARDQDERGVMSRASEPAHSIESGPVRQAIVAQDNVVRLVLKILDELLGVSSHLGCYFQTCLF